MGALHESGHNTIDDARLTPEEFTQRYSVTSLSDYRRKMLGDVKPGLWVLHAPTWIKPLVVKRYEDRTEDSCMLLNMYFNLVRPEARIRQLLEKWTKGSQSDDNRRFNHPYDK